MVIEEVLDLLHGVKKANGQFLACCPAHEDERQSLAVRQNKQGIAFYCHAGCSTESILLELHLQMSDLFMEEKKMQSVIDTEYDYVDSKGKLLYQVVRYIPKAFKQRRPAGNDWVWNLNGVERVPYLLPELLESTGPVFIVEGEKDCHTLHASGFTATTNAGGANSWKAEFAQYLKGRLVYLVPDMDDKGLAHMTAVGESLAGVCDVRFILLPEAKDVAEFFSRKGGLAVEQFNQLVQHASIFEGRLRPVVAEPEFEWPEAPVYEGLLGEFVSLIEPHTEADPIGIFMDLLVTFGNCVGGGPHYLVGATRHKLNLFCALCGDTSSARKGTGHDWIMDIFGQVDDRYVSDCVLGGLASGEGLIHAVRDPRTRIGKDDRVIVTDDGVTDKRRLFYEPELAGRTFVAAKREGSTLSALLRQAWDGSNLAVATKTNDDKATGAHISILGHATVNELLSTLRETDITGGFANRFLFFVVKRTRLMAVQTRPEAKLLTDLCNRLRLALDCARKLGQVGMTERCVDEWRTVYAELNSENDKTEKEIQFTARGAPQILRMSLVLAMVDGQREIDIPHLRQASGLWNYSAKSVEFMLTSTSADLPPELARLYKELQKTNGMCRGDIQKRLKWNGAATASVVGRFLGKKLGYEETVSSGGRPRKVLYINE